MPGFIEEFYYGNIEPQELNREFRAELNQKLNKILCVQKELRDALPPERKELLSEYDKLNLDLLTTCSADSFTRGFRIGSEFTMDTFGRTSQNNI